MLRDVDDICLQNPEHITDYTIVSCYKSTPVKLRKSKRTKDTVKFIYYTYIYRESKKARHYTLVHSFAKY